MRWHPQISMNFRAISVCAALCCAFLWPGCGSRTTDDGSRSKSASTGSAQSEIDLKRCAGFGAAEAAALLGVPPEKFKDKSQDLYEGSRSCIFENADDPARSINFTVNRASSADDAITEFAQFRQNAGVAVRTIGKEGQKAHDVPSLGDEALWTPVPGVLHLRKGRYSVQVNQPADEAMQIKIARKILGE